MVIYIHKKMKGSYYSAFDQNTVQRGALYYRGFRPEEDQLIETKNTLF